MKGVSVDKDGKLIGRLTIDERVDLIREESESEVLNMAGLREEEDIFASVWKSVRNRWAWLATNLITNSLYAQPQLMIEPERAAKALVKGCDVVIGQRFGQNFHRIPEGICSSEVVRSGDGV